MSFASQFVRPMKQEIQRKVKDVSVALVRDTAEEIYFIINSPAWPQDTLWSAANHRINVGPNPEKDFPVEPPVRPDLRGVLLNEAASNAAEQLAKLDTLAFGDRVLIGNAVPYAKDVGFQAYNGLRIYIEAAATGSAVISSRIG